MGGPFIKGWPEQWDEVLVGSAAPLSGCKGQFQEGGIRIPFMMRFPGKIKAGKIYTRPVSSLDLYATFHSMAHKKNSELKTDGVNLLSFIRGNQKNDPHQVLFWGGDTFPVCARMGDWKLVISGNDDSARLYNLRSDIGEMNDVAGSNPDIVKQIRILVVDWKKEMSTPATLIHGSN